MIGETFWNIRLCLREFWTVSFVCLWTLSFELSFELSFVKWLLLMLFNFDYVILSSPTTCNALQTHHKALLSRHKIYADRVCHRYHFIQQIILSSTLAQGRTRIRKKYLILWGNADYRVTSTHLLCRNTEAMYANHSEVMKEDVGKDAPLWRKERPRKSLLAPVLTV